MPKKQITQVEKMSADAPKNVVLVVVWLSMLSETGGEDGDGGVEDGVTGAVVLVHVDAHVRRHAELRQASLGVQDGA